MPYPDKSFKAAASARLCVETFTTNDPLPAFWAAASARLCVETVQEISTQWINGGSRLRAAVC